MIARRCLLLACALLATSCGAGMSRTMRRAHGDEAFVSAPNKARVVFVRPSSGAFRRFITLVDENGFYLGDSSAGCRFMVHFDPGEHYVTAITEGAETLKMTLNPGQTYYVELRPKLGVWTLQIQLLAVTPQSGLLPSVPAYLSRTILTVPDYIAGQALLDVMVPSPREVAQRGRDNYASYPPESKAAATLAPEDGQ